jgi:MipA family protein
MQNKSFTILLPLLLLCCSRNLLAQDALPRVNFAGPGVRIQPEYEGAAGTTSLPVLLLNFERGLFFAGTSRSMAEAGVRVRLRRSLAVGGQIAFERGRARKDSAFLRRHALADIDDGASIGPFVEATYNIGPVPVEWLMRVRQHLDQDLGAQLDLRGTCGVFGDESVRAGLFAQLTWASKKANQRHFGVAAEEAARGGLPEYSASGGARYITAGSLASIKLAPRWDALLVAEWRWALDAARRSPIMQDEAGFLATLGAIYWF